MIWPMRLSSTLPASLIVSVGLFSAGLSAQAPAPGPAPAPPQKPAQPAAPRAPAPAPAAAPAAPAPAGMADQTPSYEGEYIPGLKNLPTEELEYPHLQAADSSGPAGGNGAGASSEPPEAANKPGLFKRIADRLGADRTLFNIFALIVIIGAFVLYRIRSGRNRTRI